MVQHNDNNNNMKSGQIQSYRSHSSAHRNDTLMLTVFLCVCESYYVTFVNKKFMFLIKSEEEEERKKQFV